MSPKKTRVLDTNWILLSTPSLLSFTFLLGSLTTSPFSWRPLERPHHAPRDPHTLPKEEHETSIIIVAPFDIRVIPTMSTYLPLSSTKRLPSPLFYNRFPESATVPNLPLLVAALAPFWHRGSKNWSHSTAAHRVGRSTWVGRFGKFRINERRSK